MESPSPASTANRIDATTAIWQRLARPFDVGAMADVLMGLRPVIIDALSAVKLCSSQQADALLGAMPGLSRSLSTSVRAAALRCQGEIRGPVLWSETMSARASSFGDDDLFVCSAPQRDYDTPANRALVQALRAMHKASAALDLAPASWHGDDRLHRARSNSRAAHQWAEHPSLSGVSRDRVDARDLKRVRGGKSAARYAPALAVLEVAAEPVGPGELVRLCDAATLDHHELLMNVVDEVQARGLALPPFRVEGAALMAGPLTFIHQRHRMGDGQLHGIVLGHVVIDIENSAAASGAVGMTERSDGRPWATVRTRADVAAAVDLAVRLTRDALLNDTTATT